MTIQLVALLALFVIPSLVFTLLGRDMEFISYRWLFVILGAILCVPMLYFSAGWAAGMNELGYSWVAVDAEKCINNSSSCTLSGTHAVLMFFVGGPTIYYIDYIAGVNMHELLFDDN